MKKSQWLISFIWLAAMACVQTVSREDFYVLWSFYSLSFATYCWLVFSKYAISLKFGLSLALICRLAGFLMDPLLSDDYYRFIWDGMVTYEGVNPIAYTPSYLISHPEIASTNEGLYALLNSPDYYSVYPPLAQFVFYISYLINQANIGGNIIFLKGVVLVTDFLVIYLLHHLLKRNNLPVQRILIYALSPLIILEFTGNLHMEGLMILGLLAAIVLSDKKSILLSSLSMVFSISAKMISMLLIPFMPREMYWKKIIGWGLSTLLLTVLLFFLSFKVDLGWIKSIGLWFHSFEFNASLYYVVLKLDSLWRGYENIKIIGPLMASLTLIILGLLWIYYVRKKQVHWSAAMVLALTIYFLMTTTVHPWYLTTILTLCVISGHMYPIVWSYLVFLSYSHYSGGGFREQYVFIIVEYTVLFLWIFFEWKSKAAKNKPLMTQMFFLK